MTENSDEEASLPEEIEEVEPGELGADDFEEYVERIQERREYLRGLILDEDSELVSIEEFRQRLEEKHGIIAEEKEDGSVEFKDPSMEEREPDEDRVVESKITDIPVLQAEMMIHTDRHPNDLKPVEEEAKEQMKFDEHVGKVFQYQLENEEDPFPLEASLGAPPEDREEGKENR